MTVRSIGVKVDLTPEFLSDVLIIAFDAPHGGCWYWAEPSINADTEQWAYISPDDKTWTKVTVVETEPSDGKSPIVYTVNHPAIQRGCELLLKKVIEGADFPTTAVAILQQDAGMIDADAADVIVQYAIFGEVIYS